MWWRCFKTNVKKKHNVFALMKLNSKNYKICKSCYMYRKRICISGGVNESVQHLHLMGWFINLKQFPKSKTKQKHCCVFNLCRSIFCSVHAFGQRDFMKGDTWHFKKVTAILMDRHIISHAAFYSLYITLCNYSIEFFFVTLQGTIQTIKHREQVVCQGISFVFLPLLV